MPIEHYEMKPEDIAKNLLDERIEFRVHYPSNSTFVITVNGSVDRDKLKTLVDHGFAFGQVGDQFGPGFVYLGTFAS
jgi:hypothetical protein